MTVQLIGVNQQFKSHQVKKVLLVEDNDINRMLLRDCLSFCGYKVKGLADGLQFFPILEKFQPDLVILDLKLPDIDGYILLEEMQQNPQTAKIPVIVVSGLAFRSDYQRALNLGVREYFVKPVILSEVTQAVAKELNVNAKLT